MANRLTLSIKSLQTLRRAAGARRTVHSDEAGTILKITRALFLSKEIWIQNVLVFLAARAGVLGSLYPFGAAVFLAVLLTGERRRAVAAALALAAAGFTVTAVPRALAAAAWAVAALALSRSFSRSKKPEALFKRALLLTALFGAARALPGWIYGTSAYESVSIAVEAVILGLSTYLLLPLGELEWPLGSGRLERPAAIALGLATAVSGLGLSPVAWGWFEPAEVWHRWLVMGAALVGSGGGGAAMGTFVSVLLSLVGAFPLGGTGLYGVGGLFGGLLARRGKAGVICGFVLGQMLVSVHAGDGQEIVLGAAHTAAAAALLALTPRRWTARFSRAMPGTEARTHLELARERRLREAINSRLKDVSAVFQELAEVFAGARRAGTGQGEDRLNALVEEVWRGQCYGCSHFAACWQESFYRSYWEFVDLVAVADLKGGAVTAADLPRGLAARCIRPGGFVESFNRAMSGRALQARGRGDASFDLVPQQLRGVAELIESTAEQVRIDTGRAEEIEAQLRDEFAVRRIDVADVRVVHPGSRPELEIVYRGPCDRCGRCVQVAAGVAEWLFGQRYAGVSACRRGDGETCTVRLAPVPPYELKVEMVRLAKDGAAVSGDAAVRVDLGGGRLALMLSDGMGVGDRAAVESQATVGLFEKMLRAGFDHTFAAHTVNAVLLLRSTEETFATVDLAVIDLFSGEAEFLKVGSSPTFIKREGGVDVVRSESLPVGILTEIDVRAHRRVLEPGDVLVMMTDGILDALPGKADKEEWIARMLRREKTLEPAELVSLLVERAKQAAGGAVRDDMTVMVARLVRRRDGEGDLPAYQRRRRRG